MDGKFIIVESDEELKIAVANMKSGLLKMEIRRNAQKTLELPCDFLSQLKKSIASEEGMIMETRVHNCQRLVGILRAIKNWPGVIFLGGDTAKEIVKDGEKKTDKVIKKNI